MKNCLVIPGPFVPANEPMTLLVYKQLRLLPFHMDVYALSYWETDPDVEEKLKQDPCYSKFSVQYIDTYKNVLFSLRNINLPSALRHMQKYVDTCVSRYDSQEYIYTSSFPCYTIRAGKRIKQKNPNVTWIANFTDPINHSPYKNDPATYQEYSLPEKIAFNLYCKYYVVDQDEADAFENADILLFICEEQRDFMIDQYARHFGKVSAKDILQKSLIIPLNDIPEWNTITVSSAAEPHDEFILSHFGRIYGYRLIEEFIYAVKDFLEQNSDFPLIIEQYGEFRKSDWKLIQKLHLENHFKIHEKIPYAQCIQKMNDSDALLIFDTILPSSGTQPYLPSKILEYSLLKKNVLGVANANSPTYRIMKQSDAIVCSYDRQEILKGLNRICLYREPSVIHYSYTNQEAVEPLLERLK